MNPLGGVVRMSRVVERMSEGVGERMSEDEGGGPKKSVEGSLKRAEGLKRASRRHVETPEWVEEVRK